MDQKTYFGMTKYGFYFCHHVFYFKIRQIEFDYQVNLYFVIPKSGFCPPRPAEFYLSRQLKHDLHKFSIVETSPLNTIIK